MSHQIEQRINPAIRRALETVVVNVLILEFHKGRGNIFVFWLVHDRHQEYSYTYHQAAPLQINWTQ